MVTPNAVLEGSGALDRWLEAMGSSGPGGGAPGEAGATPLIQSRSSVLYQGEEWMMGDFFVRIATCKMGQKYQNLLVMEVSSATRGQPVATLAREAVT